MNNRKKQNNFLVHGGILALSSILVRFIGMIYRIPVVNIIGSKGNGYYSTAYSVYNILLLLSSYSLPLAVSKMVSARVTRGKWKETERVLAVAMIFAGITGTVFALLTYFGADFFCTNVLKSPMAAVALKWMAPTIFVMAFLGVLRGFFQGLQTTIPTAISQILEQIVNAGVSVGMAFVLFQYGMELATETGSEALAPAWGAAGSTIGTGSGALMALIFCTVLFFMYRGTIRRKAEADRHQKIRPYGKLMKILVLTAVPVILSTAAYNCIDIIDVGIFNSYMSRAGYGEELYNSVWGDYNAAYLLLIHLPVAFASAIASALVPSLSAAFAERNQNEVMNKIELTVKVTMVISIPCAFGLMAIGGNLARLLFTSIADDASKYLVFGGLAVVFYSLSTVTNAILQGLDHMERPVIHALIALIVHTGLALLLLYVFKLEIYAIIISYMAFSLVMLILNMISIYRLTGYLPDPIRGIGIPTIASVIVVIICFAVTFVISHVLGTGQRADLLIVALSLVLGVIAYFFGILASGCMTKAQLKALPFGTKILAIAARLNLIR